VDRLEYAGYLARTVPPQRIARVAALRLWRTARRTLEREPEPPPAEEILACFRAERVDELPLRLLAPVRGPWAFAAPPGVASAARLLRRHLPEEASRAVARAERALARRLVIFGREVPLPTSDRPVPFASAGWRAVDWEADPVSGARFDGAELPPGADVKYPWAMGRLDEAVHLACGAALTTAEPARSRAFADAALDRILDLATAPRGVQWSCAMEVALRAVDVAIALRLLAGHEAVARRPEAALEILRSLAFHQRWVEAHLEDTVAVPNNHLVADLVGIAVVGALWPALPGATAAARRALRRLEEEILAQTLPDGFTFEASVAYHRLAAELFLLGDLAADALAAPLAARTRERLAAVFAACARLIDGRGLAPQIGDNDSGRALPFVPRHPQALAFLLPLGAARFGRKELDRTPPSAELIWLLGAAGLRALESLPPGRPQRDTALPDAGIYLLRSRRFSCAIACGPNGTGGTGTHGHNDKLAVEICLDGRLLVADPGTGSYTGDPALRNRLRGTAAHSTVLVAGAEQQPLPAARLFALPDSAAARCTRFVSDELQGSFSGEHRGYVRLDPPVIHRRHVHLDRLRELLLIEDVLAGAGRQRAEARFLVPGRARVRALRQDERERLRGLLPPLPWDFEHAIELCEVALLVGAGAGGAPELRDGLYARGYGELAHALHVCFPLEEALPSVFTAAVLPMAGAAGRREEADSYGSA